MTSTQDPFELQRFLQAQAPVIDAVRDELGHGRKTSHWMWFVFPQVAGLGRSTTARRFAIASVAEAMAYYDHPQLGARLEECCGLLLGHSAIPATQILGDVDALKLHSSMTLFAAVTGKPVFERILEQFYRSSRDVATLSVLSRWNEGLHTSR